MMMVRHMRQWIAGAVLALVTVCAALPAGAEQSTLDAMLKRYRELYAARDYDAALAAAQRLEAAVRARSGMNNRNYVVAIFAVAQARRGRGQNAEAEAIYKRALTILEKAGASELDFALTNTWRRPTRLSAATRRRRFSSTALYPCWKSAWARRTRGSPR
jgi:tetratricopeptide (TPR) repeat protein